jgi:VCBS repeat-containing protein
MSISVSYNSGTSISTMTFSDGISANNVTLHLSGDYTGTGWSFTSVNGGAGTEIYDPPTDSGTVTVDSGPTGEIAAASAATIDFANAPGIFTMTAAGVWAYTLDNNNNAVNALNTGDTLTDVIHGASRNDTINGNNRNDIIIGVNEGNTDAHEIDTGPNVVRDSGVLKTSESGGHNRSIASEADERGAAPTHGASVHGFGSSSTAQVVSGGTVGAPGDSFHFKDEISGIKGSGITDVAEPNHTPASTDHLEGAAGTHGPLAISEGGETPGTLGDSFHFKDEMSSFKGSGVIDLAELDQIPASMSHHENAAGTRVPPATSEGAQAIEPPPPGQHPDDHFNIVPNHAPNALVTHVPHDLIV